MQYALLIYDLPGTFEGLSDDERDSMMGEYMAVNESDAVYGGAQLQPPTTATTVRVADGDTLTTDGPFADTKEILGGFFLVNAEDLDGALAIAARIPAARMGGSVEVRPMVEM
jgi:hypothetical protein